MYRRFAFFILSLALLGPGLPAAESEARWQDLQIGYSVGQTVDLIGEPLLRSKGRGFETWTYDDGGEVLFHGALIGWTLPVGLRAEARSDDIWKQSPGLGYQAALRRFAPPAEPRPEPRKAGAVPPAPSAGVGFKEPARR